MTPLSIQISKKKRPPTLILGGQETVWSFAFPKNNGIKLIFDLQINIRVTYKLLLLLLVVVARHALSTQNNKYL